ncbi:hypothetical protein ES703_72567 [subsurface metagenome]
MLLVSLTASASDRRVDLGAGVDRVEPAAVRTQLQLVAWRTRDAVARVTAAAELPHGDTCGDCGAGASGATCGSGTFGRTSSSTRPTKEQPGTATARIPAISSDAAQAVLLKGASITVNVRVPHLVCQASGQPNHLPEACHPRGTATPDESQS